MSYQSIYSGSQVDSAVGKALEIAELTVVNDRYLHTNTSTGALEWAEAGSSVTKKDVSFTTTTNWTARANFGYEQTISVANLSGWSSANSLPHFDVNLDTILADSSATSDDLLDLLANWGNIIEIVPSNGSVTVIASKEIDVAIPIRGEWLKL